MSVLQEFLRYSGDHLVCVMCLVLKGCHFTSWFELEGKDAKRMNFCTGVETMNSFEECATLNRKQMWGVIDWGLDHILHELLKLSAHIRFCWIAIMGSHKELYQTPSQKSFLLTFRVCHAIYPSLLSPRPLAILAQKPMVRRQTTPPRQKTHQKTTNSSCPIKLDSREEWT